MESLSSARVKAAMDAWAAGLLCEGRVREAERRHCRLRASPPTPPPPQVLGLQEQEGSQQRSMWPFLSALRGCWGLTAGEQKKQLLRLGGGGGGGERAGGGGGAAGMDHSSGATYCAIPLGFVCEERGPPFQAEYLEAAEETGRGVSIATGS